MTTPQHASSAYYARVTLGFLLIALAYVLMLDPAFAQAAGGAASGSFRCSGDRAIGTLYDSGMQCPATMSMNNVFSFLICNMERLAGNLLGQMYCSIVVDLIPAVTAMLTLAVLFFGIGFTIGVIPATAKDFQLFLLKVVFVWVFATQADYLIGTGYNLLVTGLREGTAVALSAMFEPQGGNQAITGIHIYSYLDRFLDQAMHFATDAIGANAAEGANPCKNAVFAVMAIMAVAFPPVFLLGLMIIFRIALTFLRAVFGYMYSIVGIVFLLTLSPFFLSFYLFRQTRPFFDKWIGYLVSFSLQMVILFAFLGFILSIKVDHISGGLVRIIMPVQQTVETSTLRMPWQYCTVCDFKVVDKQGNDASNYGALISEGTLQCKHNPPKPIPALGMAAPPEMTPEGKTQMETVQGALLKFAGVGLLSLLVLAYLVEYLLNYVPYIATLLAGGLGATYAPQMGGGYALGQKLSVDMPGGELVSTFEKGFVDGFAAHQDKTAIGATAAGFMKASERLVMGGKGGSRSPKTGEPYDSGQGANDPGMLGSFLHFMINPNRDSSPY